MRGRDDGDRAVEDVAPWPASARYGLGAVLLAFCGTGAVFILFEGGVLPIAGPFVAMAVAPLLVLVGTWWAVGRSRRLRSQLVDELAELVEAVERERALSAAQRSSGATDETLDVALKRSRTGLSQLSWGEETAATASVHGVARVAKQWSGESELARRAARAAALASRLAVAGRRARRRRSTT